MKKIEAESKSQQRRLKEQTGKDVSLSAKAAAALGEAPPVTDNVKEALRPGRKEKTTPVLSPILRVHDDMHPTQIEGTFRAYQAAERKGSATLLDKVQAELGAKVHEADKVRTEEFSVLKNGEEAQRKSAQAVYTYALRAAQSALDKENARITDHYEKAREESRKRFNDAVTPINAELEAKKTQITTEYTGKIADAIGEMKPILDEAKKKEAVRAAVRKQLAEERAAKEKEGALPLGPPLPTGGLVTGTGVDPAAAAAVATV